jgi:hypothetical protein
MSNPKYPEITVRLVGENGNAFYILGKCLLAMSLANIPKEEQDEFYRQATAGDYNHLLITCLEWFDIE